MIISIYAALLALMLVGLSVKVIRARRSVGAALGDADALLLQRRMRAQANFTEYTPMFLVLLGLAEMQGLAGWATHTLGFLFLIGRLMHAYSLLHAERYDGLRLLANPVWRIRGMAITFLCLGVLACILPVQFLQSLGDPYIPG